MGILKLKLIEGRYLEAADKSGKTIVIPRLKKRLF